MYRILYEKRVCKDLDKISDSDVIRIIRVFNQLSVNPILVNTKKLSGKPGLYRVRQGDYRIIYTIDHINKKIRIMLVRHRKDSYRSI